LIEHTPGPCPALRKERARQTPRADPRSGRAPPATASTNPSPAAAEVSVAEAGGNWDLSTYTDAQLRAVLERALGDQPG
jgi:hypothetical protein